MSSFTLLAPAKLNLYLRVLGRRPDGYHELETLFERIDLADTLTFESHPTTLQLSCNDPALSCGEDNLVLKAARLLQQATGAAKGAAIILEKHIPVAAGLGGGSSDAATTLLGLNRLWNLRLGKDQLLKLGASLGSDVAFFLFDSPFAIGRGCGERCEQLPVTQSVAHVLVVPDERLATSEIYRNSQFDLTAPKPSITMVAHALSNGSLSELAKGLWNDLEPEAIRRCPIITDIQVRLQKLGCLGARVSGSGSSVFGICRDIPHAHDVANRFRLSVNAKPLRQVAVVHALSTLLRVPELL